MKLIATETSGWTRTESIWKCYYWKKLSIETSNSEEPGSENVYGQRAGGSKAHGEQKRRWHQTRTGRTSQTSQQLILSVFQSSLKLYFWLVSSLKIFSGRGKIPIFETSVLILLAFLLVHFSLYDFFSCDFASTGLGWDQSFVLSILLTNLLWLAIQNLLHSGSFSSEGEDWSDLDTLRPKIKKTRYK